MRLKEVINVFLKNNYLPSKELLDFILTNKISIEELERVLSLSKKLQLDGTLSVIDFIKYELLKEQEKNVNWEELEKVRVLLEKNKGVAPFKTILSFFVDEKRIEDYLNSCVFKNIKKFKCNVEIKEKNEEKEENFIFEESETKVNFTLKEEVVSGDYKAMYNRISNEDNIFDDFIKKKPEDKDELSNQINDVVVEDEEHKETIHRNDELNNTPEEKSKKVEKEEIGEFKEKVEEKEIGSFDDNLIEEIKKKVENLVKEAHFSQNKVEWVENNLKVVKSFKANPKKVEVVDFLKYFKSKYKKIKEFLMQRASNLGKDLISIDNLTGNNEYAVIAMVRDIEQRGDFLVGIIEDLTGEIKFKVNLKEVKEAIELVPDDVALFVGKKKGKTFYVEKIVFPDIPNNSVKWLKDYGVNEDIYAVVLSDVHVGSKLFLKDRFTKFIEWLNGRNNKYFGKIGYVIVSGDLVDGVGVYPEQVEELDIISGYEQYRTFAKFLELIPSEINVIISPGNHDIVRLAEPQPVLPKDIAEPLAELNNTYLVSNPTLVLLRDYIKLLSYHGYSYDYFINNVDHLRGHLSYEKISDLVRMYLRKRHLVPSFKAAPIAPEHEDHLVIEEVPNLITSGHIHYSNIGDYKGVKILSSSCWQAITPFQEKVGHNPDPGKIPMVNLKDGSVKLLQF